MKEGNSHLGLGIAVGALLGAAATFLVIKHKDSIKEELSRVTDKLKESANDLAIKAKSVKENATEKIHDAAVKVEEKTRKA